MLLSMQNENDDHRWHDWSESKIRAEISIDEAILYIRTHGGIADSKSHSPDIYDQMLICEAATEAHPVIERHSIEHNNPVGYEVDDENANGGCRLQVNFELNAYRLNAISTLKTCTSKTPPIIIANLLAEIFGDEKTQEGWWLAVAQHYPPRPIYRVINELVKIQIGGWKSIYKPAAFFTLRIRYRALRKGWGRLCK